VIVLVKVAVDAMGGDYAPDEIVKGAISALSSLEDLYLYLVGRHDEIKECLSGLDYPRLRLEIRHAEEVIRCNDDPGLSIRNKKESSMVMALQMVRSGEADAIISAGNTGALMVGGLLFLGRIGRISRPALLTPMPSFSGRPVLYLDVGANMDARPLQLLQYAHMGRIYAQKILGNLNPRVALLNVGTEENKGNNQVKKAYQLFKENLPGFIGNIEGTEAYFDAADVVVCDGFVGNIFLKTSEGLSRAILSYFRQRIQSSFRYKAGAFLLQPVFLGLREQVDASGYGGAPLLGVKGLCVKCHGSSKARAIEQAIYRQIYPFIENHVIKYFENALELLPTDSSEKS
jgi:phosphate acyltransferase